LLCLVVTLATGALFAPGASAAEYGPKTFPEVGRCVKTKLGEGTYVGGNCQFVAAPGKGKWEWISATASEKLKFEGGGGETTIATLGHQTIKCIGANIKGEWQNEKVATVNVELQACLDQSSRQCQNVGGINKSEISSGNLNGELGFIRNEGNKIAVGMDLTPPTGQKALFTYECDNEHGLGEQNAIEGSLIGRYKPIQAMKTNLLMNFKVRKNGTQEVEKFESGLKDTLKTTYKKGLVETVGEGPSTLNVKEILGETSLYEVRVKEVPYSG